MDRRGFLRTAGAAFGAAALGSPPSTFARQARAGKPNIIFILADDLGYSELGCYGNTFNQTPNLDRLAGEGVRFTDAYAAAPVCSPTRAAFITGQWPHRLGITDYLRPRADKFLPPECVTLPEMLKAAGYATGIIGKWHLTGYQIPEGYPDRHGFDETIIGEVEGIGGCDYFHPYKFNPGIEKRLPGDEHLIDRMNLEAVDFIERHRHKPFFLFLSHHAVHTVIRGREDLVEKYRNKPGAGRGGGASKNNPHLAAQMEQIDDGAGMIVNKLDELGLANNTMVVFYSDNGGESLVTDNSPLRAGKSHLYEGGIREPLIVRYPGLAEAGSVCGEPVSTVDFYPTFAGLAGVGGGNAQQLDGASILPLLEDPEARLNRHAIYWHYPMPRPHIQGGRSSGAVRAGDWKLIEFFDTNEIELYNLSDDIGERDNLAEKMPKKADEMLILLRGGRENTGARIPDNCRDYNPDKFFMDEVARRLMKLAY
jgi:arylsulfatase A-like enzyme